MTLTSTDIRLAYSAIHGITSIAEFEKYDLMNANQFPDEWLGLPIVEFMDKAGFTPEKTVKPDELSECTVDTQAESAEAEDVHHNKTLKRVKAEYTPKRKYIRKIK